MGTKRNPGKYDCYDAADYDEPLFTLLARDPLAPMLVSLWAAIRAGDRETAYKIVTHFLDQHGNRYVRAPEHEKAAEALRCSTTMVKWQKRKRKTAPKRLIPGATPRP